MTFQQLFLLIVAAVLVIGVPAMMIGSIVDYVRHGSKNRRGGGGMTAGVGAAMQELDRLLARPSAEHRVEAETPVLRREDDEGGD